MDAQLIVIIAGVILLVAIIGSLLFLKGYSGKFTFDTQNGTRPRASEGEGSTQGVKSNGRFKLLTAGVGAVFAAIIAKLWSMQMVSSVPAEASTSPETLKSEAIEQTTQPRPSRPKSTL